jgi:hypothetical protein
MPIFLRAFCCGLLWLSGGREGDELCPSAVYPLFKFLVVLSALFLG